MVTNPVLRGFSISDCLSVCHNESQMSAIISLACDFVVWSEWGTSDTLFQSPSHNVFELKKKNIEKEKTLCGRAFWLPKQHAFNRL